MRHGAPTVTYSIIPFLSSLSMSSFDLIVKAATYWASSPL